MSTGTVSGDPNDPLEYTEQGEDNTDPLDDVAQGSISPNCPCPITTNLPPLHAAPHPHDNSAFVLTLSPNQQILPSLTNTDDSSEKGSGGTAGCTLRPQFTGYNSIRYHIFNDGIAQGQTYNLCPNPAGNLLRQDLNNLVPSQLDVSGWNKSYGNQPGYSRGREITTESGKVELGKVSASDAYQTVKLSVSTTTDANGNDITELRGTAGKYIRAIIIYYKSVKGVQSGDVARFHALFKFDVESSQTCNSINQQSQPFFQQESLIDNIGVAPSPVAGTDTGYVGIDCRYLAADIIQLYGTQLDIDHAVAICTDPKVYRESVVITNYYSASFDSTGRLFVF